MTPVRKEISKLIPTGFGEHDTNRAHTGIAMLRRQFETTFDSNLEGATELNRIIEHNRLQLTSEVQSWSSDELSEDRKDKLIHRIESQMGTLGGGNHFIEVCVDTEDNVWVMLHSGSRGIGNNVGNLYMKRAKKHCESMYIQLPDPDLAFFSSQGADYDRYLNAMELCQQYAMLNRRVMLLSVLVALQETIGADLDFHITGSQGDNFASSVIDCHHNYLSVENHFNQTVMVTRKGATRARFGDYGIIPGSMGTRSYIVRGLGNEESLQSSSHGAGRSMSRSEAKRRFTVNDLATQMTGINAVITEDFIDEIPSAYKDIDQTMANQTDLVEIVAQLRQVINVKGNS